VLSVYVALRLGNRELTPQSREGNHTSSVPWFLGCSRSLSALRTRRFCNYLDSIISHRPTLRDRRRIIYNSFTPTLTRRFMKVVVCTPAASERIYAMPFSQPFQQWTLIKPILSVGGECRQHVPEARSVLLCSPLAGSGTAGERRT